MSLYERTIRLASRLRRLLARPGAPPPHAEVVDLLHPGVIHDPYPYYAALRERGPVHFLPERELWLVVGYEEVSRAFKDPTHFSSVRPQVRFDPILNEADPPDQTRVRRAIAPYFTAAAVEALEGHARACAAELLAANAGRAEVDMVGDFATPYVERVVGGFLGLTREECEALRARLARHPEEAQEARFQDLHEWAQEQVARAAEAPPHSMAGRLFRAGDGTAHTPEEATGLLKLFWVAGITTTVRLVAAAVLQLLRDPELRRAVQADPAWVPALVEEAARMDPPEFLIWRVARPGAEVAGVAIPPGAEVRLCVGAANRDPARFPDPDRLVLERAPNPHLTFGSGPHVCPGARLARLQVRVALEELLAAWPGFHEARPLSTLTYAPSPNYRALNELFVSPGGTAAR
ncbi:MAG: cytochrome P450 [Gemmatimonadetes bacterium]|nr:cytochrome P450 [Gemmatimonadota bacterium]